MPAAGARVALVGALLDDASHTGVAHAHVASSALYAMYMVSGHVQPWTKISIHNKI